MKHAETVTFGGSGLNRAADHRSDTAQSTLWQTPGTRVTYLWRGKPLVTGDAQKTLASTDVTHPLADGALPRIFLGLDADGMAMFAQDISDWTPPDLPDTLTKFLDPSEQVHPDLPKGARFAELRTIMTDLSPRDAELAATARGVLEWHRTHSFCANCGAKSELTMAGWQRDCATCGRHHFPRTDPVVIMLITRGNSVLVGRSPGWPDSEKTEMALKYLDYTMSPEG
ncbi:MAG: NUDIX-like domain-containing protein, partial [Pseudomonadota bacterium]